VDGLSPVLEYEVALVPGVAIWVQGPADEVARSTLNPVSLVALSVQTRLIWLEETALAERPLGAFGIVASVVALATFE
jgi:hypothetical protein